MASMAGASPSGARPKRASAWARAASMRSMARSEEHTSELQSRQYIVCRLLLEKKYTSKINLPSSVNLSSPLSAHTIFRPMDLGRETDPEQSAHGYLLHL